MNMVCLGKGTRFSDKTGRQWEIRSDTCPVTHYNAQTGMAPQIHDGGFSMTQEDFKVGEAFIAVGVRWVCTRVFAHGLYARPAWYSGSIEAGIAPAEFSACSRLCVSRPAEPTPSQLRQFAFALAKFGGRKAEETFTPASPPLPGIARAETLGTCARISGEIFTLRLALDRLTRDVEGLRGDALKTGDSAK